MTVVGIRDILQHGDTDLTEIAGALGSLGFLDPRLDGRHQQGGEHGDDGDHHQELDQGEGPWSSAEAMHQVIVHCPRAALAAAAAFALVLRLM